MQTALPQNRLSALIEAKGLRAASVAAHCDVDQSTVYRWSVGRSAIPDDQKLRLAALLGVSVAFLMGWDGHSGEANPTTTTAVRSDSSTEAA